MSRIRFEPKPDASKRDDAPARENVREKRSAADAAVSALPAVQGEAETEAFALTPAEDAPKPAKKPRRKKEE